MRREKGGRYRGAMAIMPRDARYTANVYLEIVNVHNE